MLNNILNLEGVAVLDKKQQSKVIAGMKCSVFFRTENGNFWSAQSYSVERAQEIYGDGNGDPLYTFGDASATGYCCASCHTYKNHPSYYPGPKSWETMLA